MAEGGEGLGRPGGCGNPRPPYDRGPGAAGGGGSRPSGFVSLPPATTRLPVPAQYQAAPMGYREPMALPHQAAYGHGAPVVVYRAPASAAPVLAPPPAPVPVTIRAPPPSKSPAPATHQLAQGASRASAPALASSAPSAEVEKKLLVSETALAPPAEAAAAVALAATAEAASDVDLAPVSKKKKGLAHSARPVPRTCGKKVMVRANHFLVDVGDNNLFHYDVMSSPLLQPLCSSTLINFYMHAILYRLLRFGGLVWDSFATGCASSSSDETVKGYMKRFRSHPALCSYALLFVCFSVRHHCTRQPTPRPQPANELSNPTASIGPPFHPELHNFLHSFAVAINPESKSRATNRDVLSELIKLYGKTSLDGKLAAYDGRKSLYTASSLPFESEEFLVKLVDSEKKGKERAEREYTITIRIAGRTDLYHLTSDSHRVKIKKALQGVCIETSHQEDQIRRYKITGITPIPMSELIFSVDEKGTTKSVVPIEVCKIVEGQRYSKKLNDKPVTNIIRAACKRPQEREQSTRDIVLHNKYAEDRFAQEFGIKVCSELVSVRAHVLLPPLLKYHDSGREKTCAPIVGQWNMINKKMIDGGTVDNWTCLNFSRMHPEEVQRFCTDLIRMCSATGMAFNPKPFVEVMSAAPNHMENALRDVHRRATQMLAKQGTGNQLQLLIVILPDFSGSYGKIKRVCETDIGIVSQCCLPKHASRPTKQYLKNVAHKINVKVGGRNTVLERAFVSNGIPSASEIPTTIIGDATHIPPGEDSASSITAVFVCIYGYQISMPINLNTTTAREVVQAALMKRDIKVKDAYLRFNGRSLNEDSLLSSVYICQGSHINVTPRTRGGVQAYHKLLFEQLSIVLQNNAHRMFKVVSVPKDHVQPNHSQSVLFLSFFSQYIIHQMLVCVCREGHQQGYCWGGAFTLADIIISNGHIIISPNVVQMQYTSGGGDADYTQLHYIIDTAFLEPSTNTHAIHVKHLLDLLLSDNKALRQDPNFITFVINHPCLLSYAERQMVYSLVDRMILRLPKRRFNKLRNLLNEKNHQSWIGIVRQVPAFLRTYLYQTYTADMDQAFHLGRNFLNHPCPRVTLEQAEAALSNLLGYILPITVMTLVINFQNPARFNIIGIIANSNADRSTGRF
ncbi:protein argonaute MEL1-like [Phragmites australis]|uniref:protein argonaute MEL1-like n=1 Tax=Phragmites australis TaxID=29695 RepID=UPI002D783AD1|nr:protein argonaute MEL1-like [Phragmites australis]